VKFETFYALKFLQWAVVEKKLASVFTQGVISIWGKGERGKQSWRKTPVKLLEKRRLLRGGEKGKNKFIHTQEHWGGGKSVINGLRFRRGHTYSKGGSNSTGNSRNGAQVGSAIAGPQMMTMKARGGRGV